MQRVGSKVNIPKPSKRLVIIGVLLSPFVIYLVLTISIHTHNARYRTTYDKLYDAAKANGLLVDHYNRAPEPAGLNRFYDETSTYRTSSGLDSKFVGYHDDEGNIVLPAIYHGGSKHFYEGLNYAYKDGRLGFINPDGSWAFLLNDHSVTTSSSQSFFNGRAIVMKELNSSLITPQWREGAIDKEGNIIVELKYLFLKDFIGELDNEYTLAAEKTIFHSLFESMMDGIDVSLGIEYPFPPQRLIFLDKEGNKVNISQVRKSIRTLNESKSP